MEQMRLLDRRSNPFFQRGEAEFFLARRAGHAVGRISVHTALPMSGLQPDKLGTFGFFECENDPLLAASLLDSAAAWLSPRGKSEILGPVNFSLNHECGLLIDGFDTPPFILMPHNPPWYADLIERSGFSKRKDLYAWRYVVGDLPESVTRLADRVKRSPSLRVRTLDRSRFDEDARTVLRVFNDAWSSNWGFTPMHPAEFDGAVRDLRRIVDPELVLIAEKEGKAIAIAVTLPNLNEALAGLHGRLFPFGFLRLLYRLKVRRPRTGRCLMLGIEESARGFAALGLSALLYQEMSEAGRRRGIEWGELSWTLEDNDAINSAIRATGAVKYKTYRIYSKEIRA